MADDLFPLLVERIRKTPEKQHTEYIVLVLGSVHIAAQYISRAPEVSLKLGQGKLGIHKNLQKRLRHYKVYKVTVLSHLSIMREISGYLLYWIKILMVLIFKYLFYLFKQMYCIDGKCKFVGFRL